LVQSLRVEADRSSASNMTSLLNIAIIGPWLASVASSWIDMLAGLSKK